jgi:adenylate kinase
MDIPKKDRVAWLQGPSVRCEEVQETPQTPWRLVLLGAPGIGKATEADLLHQKLGARQLSTGDVFRAAGRRSECELSPAMKETIGYMRSGVRVPDSTVWEMVRERSQGLRCGGGCILAGFPRTVGQAESPKQLCGLRGTNPDGGGGLRTASE